MRYAIVIEKAENNCSAYVPDLPGCLAAGETVAAVEREMQEAIGFHLDGMRDNGITPPEPKSVVDYVDA
jgi:predicted RNase H-like HicB family nuclease